MTALTLTIAHDWAQVAALSGAHDCAQQ